MIYKNLNPDKALIWRITHRDNIPWILDHGLHCATSTVRDPGFVNIGNPELIDKRRFRGVSISPGGTLADYIPFYFTPFSVMLKNIHSGWGATRRHNDEIVILVSSIARARAAGGLTLFTNAHAYPAWTSYYSDPADLVNIDWPLLQRRDFKRDPDDPRKMERYQAEALVYRCLPVSGLLGLIVHSDSQRERVAKEVERRALTIPVYARPDWYFQ